jgi:CelD/BcsL family acetyltransferase involved in cellulose biosynthesis
MKISVLTGPAARQLTETEEFQQQWRRLYDDCPWATVFQGVDFATTWYAAYESRFEPVVVTGSDGGGRLRGLLTLAADPRTSGLFVAGTPVAEYQAWLADPADGDSFVELALQHLSEQFPNRRLTFLFLAPLAPLGWIRPGAAWGGRCVARPLPRPLLDIGDGKEFEESLRKKRYKSRLNWIGRAGKVSFSHVADRGELEALFDEIAVHSGLRLGAVHNAGSGSPDPLRREFYGMMAERPGLLHATVLRAGDAMVSAQINMFNNDQVLLGAITHSPFFAKYSPGKLHIMMLCAELAKQGIRTLDLTPGDSDYKERLASHHDEVHVLDVFFNRAHCARYKATRRLTSGAKYGLRKLDLDPARTAGAVADLKHRLSLLGPKNVPAALLRAARERARSTAELCVYTRGIEGAGPTPDAPAFNRDHVPDLLAYRPVEADHPTRGQFLKEALEALEGGAHAYTYAEGGQLLHCSWLAERQSRWPLRGVGREVSLPPDSAVLTTRYTHPRARGNGLFAASIARALSDAANAPGVARIFTCVPSDDRASRDALEALGFEHRFSFFTEFRLGRKTVWSNAPKELMAEPSIE